MKQSPILALMAVRWCRFRPCLRRTPKDKSASVSRPKALLRNARRHPSDYPDADRHEPGKVFLERADRLMYDQVRDSDVQVLVGNVLFRKGDMYMYCDSARFNEGDIVA